MADFPSLSVKPDVENYSVKPAVDPTIRSEFENGFVHTRPRFTVAPRLWAIVYHNMSNIDKQTLEAFEKARGYGGEAFNWTDPVDSQSHSVRFAQLVEFRLEENGIEWMVNMQLVEANPSS